MFGDLERDSSSISQRRHLFGLSDRFLDPFKLDGLDNDLVLEFRDPRETDFAPRIGGC